MADEEQTEGQQKSGGSGKGLMIALIVLVVILLIAVGVGGYFLYTKLMSDGMATPGSAKIEKQEADEDAKEFFQASINDLVLNITNSKGRGKLMKLSFSLKSTEPTIEAIVEANKAEIVDVVIGQISARSSEELLTVGGKELLKEELIEEINHIINEATATNKEIKQNIVKKIFFTSFVIK